MITRLPLAALIIASLFWGTAVSVTKYALRGFGPITLLAISLIAGTAVLWTIVILRGHRSPPPWRLAVQDADHGEHAVGDEDPGGGQPGTARSRATRADLQRGRPGWPSRPSGCAPGAGGFE